MREKIMSSLKIAAVAALSLSCFAAQAFAVPTFTVTIDQARPLNLSAPAAGIVVGNPSIVGVSLQNDRLLFLTGRSYGITNLIVVGANGRPIYEARVSVAPDDADTTVTVTRGFSTVRHNCNPICRKTPDISDDPAVFDQVSKQSSDHAGQASGTGQ